MRRTLAGTVLALTAVLLLAGSVAAGGWASIVLDDPDITPTAGQPTTIGFTMWQHARTRVSWPQATITLRRDGSDAAVVVDARADGPTGHYTAVVTLPSAGSWSIAVTSKELDLQTKLKPLSVASAAAVGAAPPNAPAEAAAVGPGAGTGQVGAPAQTTQDPVTQAPASTATPLIVIGTLVALGLIVLAASGLSYRNGAHGRRRTTAER